MTWLLDPTGQVWRTCEFDLPGDYFDMYLVSINLTRDFLPTDHENLIVFLFIDILYAVIRLACTKYEFHECFCIKIYLNEFADTFQSSFYAQSVIIDLVFRYIIIYACKCVAKINQLNHSLTKLSIIVHWPDSLGDFPPPP